MPQPQNDFKLYWTNLRLKQKPLKKWTGNRKRFKRGAKMLEKDDVAHIVIRYFFI